MNMYMEPKVTVCADGIEEAQNTECGVVICILLRKCGLIT